MTTMTPPTGRATGFAAPLLTRNYDWRDDSACRNEDPELFFPAGTGRWSQQQTEDAKQVCARCPVRSECLEWALSTDQYVGVWGGTSEEERRKLLQGGQHAFVRCLEMQEFIEGRLKERVALRELAREVGVSREVLRRAVRYFEQESAEREGQVAA